MSSEENNSGVGSNSTSTTTANVKSGNAEIGNVKTGNTEIGRMEWPFSATVLEAVAMLLLILLFANTKMGKDVVRGIEQRKRVSITVLCVPMKLSILKWLHYNEGPHFDLIAFQNALPPP